ncbi:hypothetical protein [Sphingomonas sp. R86521]|uniref:hypothetical protein n=1 Tax=Sphingomonas sp. R86521 TaxID=3093860 RepID=UPI0036D33CD3
MIQAKPVEVGNDLAIDAAYRQHSVDLHSENAELLHDRGDICLIPTEAKLEADARCGCGRTQHTAANLELHYVLRDLSLGHNIAA